VGTLGEDYRVDLTVQRDTLSEAEWAWFTRIDWGQTVRLYDAQGRALCTSKVGTSSIEDGKIERSLVFSCADPITEQKVGPPVRCVWEIPTQIRSLVVPFEFTNLPMP
jgi:hypothetical protein